MAKVDYFNLADGYTLSLGDTFLIHGCKYEVTSRTNVYYCRSLDYHGNDTVFKLFNIKYPETDTWAKKFGKVNEGGCFPEFFDLADLTKFVKAIYEKPIFNIGDTVRVKKRTEKDDDYPFSFTDDMIKLEGKTFKIRETSIMFDTTYHNAKESIANGDINRYELREDEHCYKWHSSMLELVSHTETETSKEPTKEKGFLEKAIETIASAVGPDKNNLSDGQIIIKPIKKIKTTIKL